MGDKIVNTAPSIIKELKYIRKDSTKADPKNILDIRDMKIIGTGYNADVYCCTENNEVLKVGDKGALEIEYTVYRDLKKIGFPVIEMKYLGKGILSKPYVDPKFFANNIAEYSKEQKEGLENLWKKGIQYAIITGIPLDLKADNLWWDDKHGEWILVDAGPKLDDNDSYKYEFTLDLKNGEDFIRKLKKGEGSREFWNVKLVQNSNETFLNSQGITDKISIPPNSVDYDVELEKLKVKTMKILADNDKAKTSGIFYLRFADLNQEVVDLVRSNINLAKESCLVLSQCNMQQEVLKTEINAITKLREDTAKYHSTLTSEEKNVLKYYTGNGYKNMNKCLRDADKNLNCDTPEIADRIVTLEKILKNAPKLNSDITVYRGIDEKTDKVSSKISKALSALEPGDFWEDRAFVSTSSQHPPEGFVGNKCCIFQIALKAGTPAYYIGEDSEANKEEEIILLPGMLLRFLGKRIMSYRGRKVNTYMFECAGCNVDNRYAISPSPIEKRGPLFPFQPQDRKVDRDRLNLFNLTEMYNRYIPDKSEDSVRFMTWNLHEWRNAKKQVKRNEILEKITTLNPDVLAFQESTGSNYGVGCIADQGSYGEKLRNDIVVKKGINVFIEEKVSLGYDRCMMVVGLEFSNGEKIFVGNLHLDVTSSTHRLENIETAIRNIERLAEGNNIVIMGDFNSYRRNDYNEESYKDLEKIKGEYGEGMKIFEAVEYIERLGYKETFDMKEVLNPINTNIYGGRIDFIFVSPNFNKDLLGTYAYYSSLSDHIAIIADFHLPGVEIPKVNIFEKEKTIFTLKNADDKELINLCATVPEYNAICKNDNFWKERLIEKYGKEVADMKMDTYKMMPRSWKDYYLSIYAYEAKKKFGGYGLAKAKALENGLLDVVRYLTYRYYSANEKLYIGALTGYNPWIEAYGKTADIYYGLVGAIEKNDENLIRYFIDLNSQELPNAGKWSYPLLVAAKTGRNDLVQLFYDKGARELGAAYDAAKNNNHEKTAELIRTLMNEEKNKKIKAESAKEAKLEKYLKSKFEDKEKLIKYSIYGDGKNTPSLSKSELLLKAVNSNDIVLVKTVLSHGADLDYKSGIAIENAIDNAYGSKNWEIVKVLISHWMKTKDISEIPYAGLVAETMYNNNDMFNYILSQVKNIESVKKMITSSTLIPSDAKSYLISQIDKFQKKNEEGNKDLESELLLKAVKDNDILLVKKALSNGADLNYKSGIAIYYAIEKAYGSVNWGIVKELVSHWTKTRDISEMPYKAALLDLMNNDMFKYLLSQVNTESLKKMIMETPIPSKHKSHLISRIDKILKENEEEDKAKGNKAEGNKAEEDKAKGNKAKKNKDLESEILLQAINTNNIVLVKEALSSGADLKYKSGIAIKNAIDKAYEYKNWEIIKMLISHWMKTNDISKIPYKEEIVNIPYL